MAKTSEYEYKRIYNESAQIMYLEEIYKYCRLALRKGQSKEYLEILIQNRDYAPIVWNKDPAKDALNALMYNLNALREMSSSAGELCKDFPALAEVENAIGD